MTSLHLLVQAERQSAQERVKADAAHKADLRALHDGLDARHSAYCSLFEPLIAAAEMLKVAIPEVHSNGLHEDRHRWGNSGLHSVTHGPDGFTRIETMDSFRGETSAFVAYIPTRYLGADGESLMQAEAARLQRDLDAKRRAKAEKDRAVNERRERSKLKRLQAKYA